MIYRVWAGRDSRVAGKLGAERRRNGTANGGQQREASERRAAAMGTWQVAAAEWHKERDHGSDKAWHGRRRRRQSGVGGRETGEEETGGAAAAREGGEETGWGWGGREAGFNLHECLNMLINGAIQQISASDVLAISEIVSAVWSPESMDGLLTDRSGFERLEQEDHGDQPIMEELKKRADADNNDKSLKAYYECLSRNVVHGSDNHENGKSELVHRLRLVAHCPPLHRPDQPKHLRTLILGQEKNDRFYSHGKSLTRLSIQNVIKSAVTSRTKSLPINPKSSLHLLLTSADVAVQDFGGQVCGFHYFTFPSIVGYTLPYAWVGNSATQCPGSCAYPFAVPTYIPGLKPKRATEWRHRSGRHGERDRARDCGAESFSERVVRRAGSQLSD
ncbi:hypothetical protein Syun_012745 [Stephania yunnanensis]|uniref:Uncharacterized protein n=1 Tax=Stephania yunnanensis TaxID=152371 RepID=A0AAP0K124_9MAGN